MIIKSAYSEGQSSLNKNWLLNQFKQYHGGLHLKSDGCIDKRGLDSSHLEFLLMEDVIQSHCILATRNTKFITPSSELGAEIEPNTVENQNIDEPAGVIPHDDKESSNEQSENEEGKLTALIELLGEIAILICEAENIEVKPFFPLIEEKVLIEAQKFASVESEHDEETSDESSDSSMKSICCSNSNYGENEESYDDSKEN